MRPACGARNCAGCASATSTASARLHNPGEVAEILQEKMVVAEEESCGHACRSPLPVAHAGNRSAGKGAPTLEKLREKLDEGITWGPNGT